MPRKTRVYWINHPLDPTKCHSRRCVDLAVRNRLCTEHYSAWVLAGCVPPMPDYERAGVVKSSEPPLKMQLDADIQAYRQLENELAMMPSGVRRAQRPARRLCSSTAFTVLRSRLVLSGPRLGRFRSHARKSRSRASVRSCALRTPPQASSWFVLSLYMAAVDFLMSASSKYFSTSSASEPGSAADEATQASLDAAEALCCVEWLVRQGERGPAMQAVLEDLDAARNRGRLARAVRDGARS